MQMYKVWTDDRNVDVDSEGHLMSFGEVQQYTRGEAIKKARMFNGKIMKAENHEQETCPKCDGTSLEFSDREINDNVLEWDYTCPDCNHKGTEIYNLVFVQHKEQPKCLND